MFESKSEPLGFSESDDEQTEADESRLRKRRLWISVVCLLLTVGCVPLAFLDFPQFPNRDRVMAQFSELLGKAFSWMLMISLLFSQTLFRYKKRAWLLTFSVSYFCVAVFLLGALRNRGHREAETFQLLHFVTRWMEAASADQPLPQPGPLEKFGDARPLVEFLTEHGNGLYLEALAARQELESLNPEQLLQPPRASRPEEISSLQTQLVAATRTIEKHQAALQQKLEQTQSAMEALALEDGLKSSFISGFQESLSQNNFNEYLEILHQRLDKMKRILNFIQDLDFRTFWSVVGLKRG